MRHDAAESYDGVVLVALGAGRGTRGAPLRAGADLDRAGMQEALAPFDAR